MDAFSDPQAVARYAENPPRLVPGYADMQRMARLLITERVGDNARVLVLGAGGGLELKAFALAHPDWTFLGIDPSAPMLDLARMTLGDLISRVDLHEGFIDSAPQDRFDAAACILTMHFIERDDRLTTLHEIRRRLEPGAPFVSAHFSIPPGPGGLDTWLARYSAFAIDSGVDPSNAQAARSEIAARLPILSPNEDEQLLRDAGFDGVDLFYAGFAFRGWIAYA